MIHKGYKNSHGLIKPVPCHLKLDLVVDEMGVQLEVLLEVTRRPGFPVKLLWFSARYPQGVLMRSARETRQVPGKSRRIKLTM